MNSIFTNVLLVVHVAVCLLLCLLVLMQRPKQEGLGAAFGGGMTDQAFGARTTDVLQKGTVYLGTLLFIITLSLAVLVSAKSKSGKVDVEVEETKEKQIEQADLQSAEDADKENDAVNPTPTPAEDEKPEVTPAPAEGDKVEATTPPVTAPVPAEGDKSTDDADSNSSLPWNKKLPGEGQSALGAIIGHQSGKGLEGAAIGAALGGVAGNQVGKLETPAEAPKKEETPQQP